MPCLRWQKRYENEETAKSFTEYPGLPGPYEGPGAAPGFGDYNYAPDYREHFSVLGSLDVAMVGEKPCGPAGPEYADSDHHQHGLRGCHRFYRKKPD